MAVLQFNFYSQCLQRLVPVTGIVPIRDGSSETRNAPEKLPAIYLLHGYSGIDTDWLYGSDIKALAQEYNVAVFCPSGENSFYLDDEVGGEKYATYIGQELVDITRRLFPLSEKREDTVIAGFSMGGYGSARNGLYYDTVFGAIFSFSSGDLIPNMMDIAAGKPDPIGKSIAYYERIFGRKLTELPGSDRDLIALAKQYAERNGKLPLIYTACGTEDHVLESSRRFANTLSSLPGTTLYEEWPGVHNWKFWNVAMKRALAWWTSNRT